MGNQHRSARKGTSSRSSAKAKAAADARTGNSATWIALLCAVVGGLLYSNTLQNGFVFDDRKAILENIDVVQPFNFERLFNNDFWGMPVATSSSHKSYRPLTVLSFQVDHYIQGDLTTAEQFHRTNTILYAVCCALVVFFLDALAFRGSQGRRRDWSFENWVLSATGLLFAVHPLHTEAVASIVGRAEILSAIFFCLATIVYQRIACRPSGSSAVSEVLLWSLWLTLAVSATFCKEQGIAVFPLCVAWDVLIRSECLNVAKSTVPNNDQGEANKSHQGSVGALAFRVANVIAAVAMTVVARMKVAGNAAPDFRTTKGGLQVNVLYDIESPRARFLTLAKIWSINFRLLLAPSGLSASWVNHVQPVSIDDSQTILSIVQENVGAVVTFAALIMWLFTACFLCGGNRTVSRLLLVAGATTVIAYLPASNIFVYVGFTIAERILFLPSIGICVLLGTIFATVRKSLAQRQRPLSVVWIALGLCLVTLWGVQTRDRNEDWFSGTTLWRANILTQPQNPESYYALGEEAMYAHRAMRTAPDMDRAALDEILESAINNFQLAVSMEPKWALAHNSLGTALEKKHGYAAGLTSFDTAIALNPRYQAAYYNKGSALTKLGRYQEAIVPLETAANLPVGYDRVDYVPNIFMHLALAHKGDGRFLEAESNFKKAIELNPRNDKAYSNYANMLGSEGRMDEAIVAFRNALSIAPNNPTTLKNYGTLLYRAHRKDEAIAAFQRATEVEPRNPAHFIDLGKIIGMSGQYDRARQIFQHALKLDPSNKWVAQTIKQLSEPGAVGGGPEVASSHTQRSGRGGL